MAGLQGKRRKAMKSSLLLRMFLIADRIRSHHRAVGAGIESEGGRNS
ncbi:hypothetical protein ACQKKX_19305 [Neorhizobium sp. NPDC001467]